MEKNLDFDKQIDRKNTNCLKYDFAKKRHRPEDILPLWVADMDFKTSSYIQDALHEVVEHGIFGYSELDPYTDADGLNPDGSKGYFAHLKDWLKERHQWDIESKWLVKTPGIVYALALAVKSYTEVGDAVLINQPVYYPFSEVISDNGRKVVSADLKYDVEKASYSLDFDAIEDIIVRNRVKLYLFCSPHNPVGRVWTKEELTTLGHIAKKHGVLVVCDEIHHDFILEGTHTVFASIEDFSDFTITCIAPSKTFNIAGLQLSNILISNEILRKKFIHELNASGYSQLNVMGLVAADAAYAHGAEWLDALLPYLRGNVEFLQQYLKENLPQIRMIVPQGTYLVWLDCNGLNLCPHDLEDLIVNKAGLWLDSGAIFGRSGAGFQRINVACPRATLELALLKLKTAVEKLS